MLVKLGNVWVDPAHVELLFKDVVDGGIYYRNHTLANPISLGVGTQEVLDGYAAVINEALEPKQSWPEEVSETEQ